MLTWFTGLGVWIRLGIVAGILALFAGMVWYVHHAIWKDGFAAAEAKYLPQLTKREAELASARKEIDTAIEVNKSFEKELDRLHEVTAEQQKSVDMYKQRVTQAEIQVRSALASVVVMQKKYAAEIARLQMIVNSTSEGSYEEADAILRGITRDRLRDAAGTPAPANQPSAPSGTGGGAGRLTVH